MKQCWALRGKLCVVQPPQEWCVPCEQVCFVSCNEWNYWEKCMEHDQQPVSPDNPEDFLRIGTKASIFYFCTIVGFLASGDESTDEVCWGQLAATGTTVKCVDVVTDPTV